MAIVLSWKPRTSPSSSRTPASGRIPGKYAGRARFTPKYPDWIPHELTGAIGQVVAVAFAGIAPYDGPFPGQELFREWQCDDVLSGYPIPARDLEFLDAESAAV